MLARELSRVGVLAVDCPIGSRVPREVLSMHFTSKESPCQARMAINDLAKLHYEKPLNTFCKTLDQLYLLPTTRKEQLSIHGLACDRMPLVCVVVWSVATLIHVERFFEVPFKREMELCLRIQMPQSMMSSAVVDTSEEVCEYLSELAVVLEKIRSSASNVKLVMVELNFGAYVFDDDSVVRAASRVCALATQDISVITRLKVSILVARSSSKRLHHAASLSAWGELLQNVCRVGFEGAECGKKAREVVRHEAQSDCDDFDRNMLHVKFSHGSDARLVAAFWSAIAYSRGYSSLQVDELDEPSHISIEDSEVQARYTALALMSPQSSFTRISWYKSELTAFETIAMQQVKASPSVEALAPMLWHRPWNLSREGHVFQVETLNVETVRAFGVILHDPTDREWVDLLVPGFCQCSIKRNQLPQLRFSSSNEAAACDKTSLQSFCSDVRKVTPETLCQLGGLIPVVGSCLEKLDLHTMARSLAASDLLAALTFCPRLIDLAITIDVPESAIDITANEITARGLKRLRIRFAASSSDTQNQLMDSFLFDVLAIVGSHIETIHIYPASRGIKSPRLLGAIMSSSPRLSNLTLGGLDVRSLEPVIEAYREHRTALTSLCLSDCRLEPSSLANFATFLAFSTAPKLQHFAFKYTRDDQEEPVTDKSALLEFLGMLKANKTLLSLRLTLGSTKHDLDPYKKHFHALDGEILPVQGAPAPLKTSLALLSALRVRQITQDPNIVRYILGFTAARAKRSVVLDIDE